MSKDTKKKTPQEPKPGATVATQLNLMQAIFDKIEAVGVGEASIYFGRSQQTIQKWQSGTAKPDVGAAQTILDEAFAAGLALPVFDTPPEQGETRLKPDVMPEAKPTATTDGKEHEAGGEKLAAPVAVELKKAHKPFAILSPTTRLYNFAVVLSILGNWKSTLPPEIQAQLSTLDIEPDTSPHIARNLLATRFLASGHEWSFWIDSDTIAPTGNPKWFRKRAGGDYKDEFLNQSALRRLTSHNKTIVSAIYSERRPGGAILASPGMNPKGMEDKALCERLKKGPFKELYKVDWAGFGCVAVHRKVFLDILKKFPDLAAKKEGEPHQFFTALGNGPSREDQAFCKRALDAGHPTFLDCSVFCGHTGTHSYLPG